jgi:hypothetical protein
MALVGKIFRAKRALNLEIKLTLNPTTKHDIRRFVNGYVRSVQHYPFTSEIDYIRKTVQYFSNRSLGPPNGRIVTQASEIHGTPKVEYFSQWINDLVEIEFADLIFVYKHIINRVIVEKRAVFVQCKYTKSSGYDWDIQQNQFDFLSTFPCFRFSSPRHPKIYYIEPNAISFAMYGFGAAWTPSTPIYQPAKRILKNRANKPHVKTKFNYLVNPILGWDSSQSFLLRLMQGRLGENLMKNDLVDDLFKDLYVAVGMTPDPPDDLKFIELKDKNEKGIALIEIKIEETMTNET